MSKEIVKLYLVFFRWSNQKLYERICVAAKRYPRKEKILQEPPNTNYGFSQPQQIDLHYTQAESHSPGGACAVAVRKLKICCGRGATFEILQKSKLGNSVEPHFCTRKGIVLPKMCSSSANSAWLPKLPRYLYRRRL